MGTIASLKPCLAASKDAPGRWPPAGSRRTTLPPQIRPSPGKGPLRRLDTTANRSARSAEASSRGRHPLHWQTRPDRQPECHHADVARRATSPTDFAQTYCHPAGIAQGAVINQRLNFNEQWPGFPRRPRWWCRGDMLGAVQVADGWRPACRVSHRKMPSSFTAPNRFSGPERGGNHGHLRAESSSQSCAREPWGRPDTILGHMATKISTVPVCLA